MLLKKQLYLKNLIEWKNLLVLAKKKNNMEIQNKAQLLEFIRKESLKLFKENQAFTSLEDKVVRATSEREEACIELVKHHTQRPYVTR